MIVMVKTDEPAFAPRKFSHIACDVEGCEATFNHKASGGKSAFELGWHMEGGKHRCPEHVETDAPARPIKVEEEV